MGANQFNLSTKFTEEEFIAWKKFFYKKIIWSNKLLSDVILSNVIPLNNLL